MRYIKYIYVFFITILLFVPVYSEVSLYSDSECAHILIDNLNQDLKSIYIKNAFGETIEDSYDCWSNSYVRLKNIGKFIDGSNAIDIASWILLENVENDFYVFRRRIDVYTDTNESFPCQSIPVFTAPEGLPLLSVGGERGFVSAALSKANQLYLVDYTPDVVVYNYIVYILLKSSNSQSDYLFLRLSADCEAWITAFSKANIEIHADLRRDVPYLWKFWNDNVRFKKSIFGEIEKTVREIELNNTVAIPFTYPQNSSFDVNLQSFANSNYIYDENLFKWVKSLADNNQIFIYLADISDPIQLKELIDHVYPNKFGVIDLSNLIGIDEETMKFTSTYFDELDHQKCFRVLKPVSDDNTTLLWTGWSPIAANSVLTDLKQWDPQRAFWVYRALSLNKALSGDLGDIWRSELTLFEGCRIK